MSANAISETVQGWARELEFEGELERLVTYAKEQGLCYERDRDVELLEVEIRMIGDASFYVLGDQDEVREAFLDEQDSYCEIDDVQVSVRPVAGEHSQAHYEVVKGRIRPAGDAEEGKVDPDKVATTREQFRKEFAGLIQYYAPLGRSAAIGRAVMEIATQIEGKAAC